MKSSLFTYTLIYNVIIAKHNYSYYFSFPRNLYVYMYMYVKYMYKNLILGILTFNNIVFYLIFSLKIV